MAKFYDCEICGAIHPWEWDGDCRDDANRLTWDDLPPDADVREMSERVAADQGCTCDDGGSADCPVHDETVKGELK